MTTVTPPQSIEQLLERAEKLAGKSLAQLAEEFRAQLPDHLLLEKGWIGQFIEHLLGATSGSLPQPDFPELGVELKTIPINPLGKPLESTFVSVVNLHQPASEQWETSIVKKKLEHVLWMPIIVHPNSPLNQRIIGMPLLWRPSADEWQILKNDWEETMEKVCLGKFGQLNARFGQALQVRPKAANSKVLTDVVGSDGEITQTLPRGFYLRSSFTQKVLTQLSYS
ncbi:DNA mismatch repair endonuclease MutH [Pleionea litopenaei]|uniref:DNA mismatch repair protein MutH n=1 Tax=Pleionea litopenaei TaxID=3070815 RepID=A0AA51RQM9_9GAMM|nr:DNA mismatch repair endonuclease MutH [Pleionea sp. HL-JVS1]WMS85760.1 DNA mismatch repair endonuclease MutH [Pleionea sp. HL-JVS1]